MAGRPASKHLQGKNEPLFEELIGQLRGKLLLALMRTCKLQ
jgi:hypothetical protein